MKTHYIYESTGHIANGSIVDEQNHALLKNQTHSSPSSSSLQALKWTLGHSEDMAQGGDVGSCSNSLLQVMVACEELICAHSSGVLSFDFLCAWVRCRTGGEVAMRGDERAAPACWRVFNGGEMRLAIAWEREGREFYLSHCSLILFIDDLVDPKFRDGICSKFMKLLVLL